MDPFFVSDFMVSEIIRFRNICMSHCTFSIVTRDPHEDSFPPAMMSGCPRCMRGRKRRDRTTGSARLVFLTEGKHVLTAGVRGEQTGGVSKLRNVWSLLLKNIRQLSIE